MSCLANSRKLHPRRDKADAESGCHGDRSRYLDYNASAPLLAAAREAMLAAMDGPANPSSVHSEGRAARRLIEAARRGIEPCRQAENVIFTSGATGSRDAADARRRMGRGPLRMSRLYVCAADHICLLSGGRFASTAWVIGVDGDGIVDLAALRTAQVLN